MKIIFVINTVVSIPPFLYNKNYLLWEKRQQNNLY